MLKLMSYLYIKKGLDKDSGGSCGDWTAAYVLVYEDRCDVSTSRDCGTKDPKSARYIIHICEAHWKFGAGVQIGTIVHEASHHFGTDDEAYCDQEDCLKLPPEDARNNADSYR